MLLLILKLGNIYKLGRLIAHDDCYCVNTGDGSKENCYIFLFRSKCLICKKETTERTTEDGKVETETYFTLIKSLQILDLDTKDSTADKLSICDKDGIQYNLVGLRDNFAKEWIDTLKKVKESEVERIKTEEVERKEKEDEEKAAVAKAQSKKEAAKPVRKVFEVPKIEIAAPEKSEPVKPKVTTKPTVATPPAPNLPEKPKEVSKPVEPKTPKTVTFVKDEPKPVVEKPGTIPETKVETKPTTKVEEPKLTEQKPSAPKPIEQKLEDPVPKVTEKVEEKVETVTATTPQLEPEHIPEEVKEEKSKSVLEELKSEPLPVQTAATTSDEGNNNQSSSPESSENQENPPPPSSNDNSESNSDQQNTLVRRRRSNQEPPPPGWIVLPTFFDPPPPPEYRVGIEVQIKKTKKHPKITRKLVPTSNELERKSQLFLQGYLPIEKVDHSAAAAHRKLKSIKNTYLKSDGTYFKYFEDTYEKALNRDFKSICTPASFATSRAPAFEYQYFIEDPRTGLCLSTDEIESIYSPEELERLLEDISSMEKEVSFSSRITATTKRVRKEITSDGSYTTYESSSSQASDFTNGTKQLKPVFLKPIRGVKIEPGDNAVFDLHLKNKPSSIIWLKNNKPLDDRLADRIEQKSDDDNFKYSLEIKHCLESDSGLYTARAIHGLESATCTAHLDVHKCKLLCRGVKIEQNIIFLHRSQLFQELTKAHQC